MKKIGVQFAAIALVALSLEGCASGPGYDGGLPAETGRGVVQNGTEIPGGKKLQCVPFARAHSGVKLFGDAGTWWDQAGGKYRRSDKPEVGAVIVLNDYAGADRGHVAVVRNVISAREIRVDHANWLNDGSIYLNDPVADVSRDNDWSAVRVWNIRDGSWGAKAYPVQGFIGGTAGGPVAGLPRARRTSPGSGESPPDRLVQAGDDTTVRLASAAE